MSERKPTSSAAAKGAADPTDLFRQYGCGPIRFSGTADALYERHLVFDNVVGPRTPARASASRPSRAPSGTCSRSAGS